jgi:hypothetical protein
MELKPMDQAKALNIVSTLANGVNPITGEVFPPDSPYQTSEIVRALFVAARALDGTARVQPPAREARPRSESLPNVGKPWSSEEDTRLLAEFDRGRSPRELASVHGRTLAGIEARLEKLGRISAQQRVTTNRYYADEAKRNGNANMVQR